MSSSNKPKRIRMPRPLGTTLMAKEAHLTLSHKNKETTLITEDPYQSIRNYIIRLWTNNQMSLNGQIYSIEQLAIYLNTSEHYIHKRMQIAMKEMSKWLGDGDKLKENARAIFFGCLKKGLEIQAHHEAQVGLLKAKQGGKYVPFLTSALNQALANLTATQGPIHTLLKSLSGPETNNIFITNNTQNNAITNQYITVEEGLKLIKAEMQSMADNPALADAYILTQPGLPDVAARTQDLRSIGIGYNGSSDGPNPDHHEDRGGRAFEGRIEDEDEFRA